MHSVDESQFQREQPLIQQFPGQDLLERQSFRIGIGNGESKVRLVRDPNDTNRVQTTTSTLFDSNGSESP